MKGSGVRAGQLPIREYLDTLALGLVLFRGPEALFRSGWLNNWFALLEQATLIA